METINKEPSQVSIMLTALLRRQSSGCPISSTEIDQYMNLAEPVA